MSEIGIRQEYAAFSSGSKMGSIGMAFQLFDSGDMEGRGDNTIFTGAFSIKYVALSLSYARLLTGDVAVGVTYKQLFEKLSQEDAGGYAVDAGIAWKTALQGLSVGAAARNFGRMNILKNERTKLPSDASVGLRYRGIIPNIGWDYILVSDYVAPQYGSKGVRLGLEVEPVDRLFLRTGYRSDSDFEDVSFGVGLNLGMFAADVSYTPMVEFKDNALRFTLSLAGF
jgi:hypothetical protein